MAEDQDRLTEILGKQVINDHQSISDCLTRKPGETSSTVGPKGSTGLPLCIMGSITK